MVLWFSLVSDGVSAVFIASLLILPDSCQANLEAQNNTKDYMHRVREGEIKPNIAKTSGGSRLLPLPLPPHIYWRAWQADRFKNPARVQRFCSIQ